MKKNLEKKLKLHRETIRRLDPADLQGIALGAEDEAQAGTFWISCGCPPTTG